MQHIESVFYWWNLLLFFCFLSSSEICIWSGAILFRVYFMKNKSTWSKMTRLPFIVVSKVWKGVSIILSALALIMVSMLSLFECIKHSWFVLLEKIKLIALVNLVFLVSFFVRLFISFRYGLILLINSTTERVLFLSPLLSYSI